MISKSRRLSKLAPSLNTDGNTTNESFSSLINFETKANKYDTVDDLPAPVAGSLALIDNTNILYFSDGNGWYIVSKFYNN